MQHPSRLIDIAAQWASFAAALIYALGVAAYAVGVPLQYVLTPMLFALPAVGLVVLGVSLRLYGRTQRAAIAVGVVLLTWPAFLAALTLPELLKFIHVAQILLALAATAYAFVPRSALRVALRILLAMVGLVWLQDAVIGLTMGRASWFFLVPVALLLLAATGLGQVRPPSSAEPASTAGAP